MSSIEEVEAKKEENELGEIVAEQAENYAVNPQNWYGLWFEKNGVEDIHLCTGKITDIWQSTEDLIYDSPIFYFIQKKPGIINPDLFCF